MGGCDEDGNLRWGNHEIEAAFTKCALRLGYKIAPDQAVEWSSPELKFQIHNLPPARGKTSIFWSFNTFMTAFTQAGAKQLTTLGPSAPQFSVPSNGQHGSCQSRTTSVGHTCASIEMAVKIATDETEA